MKKTFYQQKIAKKLSTVVVFMVGVFVFSTVSVQASVTVSGTLYENDGVTIITTAKDIVVAVATSTPSRHATTTDAAGNFSVTAIATSSIGSWSAATAAGDDDSWQEVVFGNGRFVAVGNSGDKIMTSLDGITWSTTSPAGVDPSLYGVTYGNGMFVAVGRTNTDDTLLTSPDGLTWTIRTGLGDWQSVTYGDGMFVAVGDADGGNDPVMTSSDGITWTTHSAAGDDDLWRGVTFGEGRFVAVAFCRFSLSDDCVMYSDDGVNWSTTTAAGDDDAWLGVTYGDGRFVAVANPENNAYMYSDDGVTWTGSSDPYPGQAKGVGYANGLYIALGQSFGSNVLHTSTNGDDWTGYPAAGNNDIWNGVAYGNGRFVVVGESGDRVMYADAGFGKQTPITVFVDGETEDATTLTYGKNGSSSQTISSIDLYEDTVRFEHASSSAWINLADADVYDAADDADILFTATTSTTTITADVEIATNTNIFAPQHLDIDGDIVMEGMFAAEQGEVLLTGGDQAVVTTATTTFYQLHKTVTATSTLTFSSGEEYVFEDVLELSGVSGGLLQLRASTTDSEYFFRPNATATVSYLDVKDSHNISATTTSISCTTGCITSGNNSGWNFGAAGASLTVADHDDGQVSNVFSFKNEVDIELFAFKLSTTTVTATVTNMVIDLSGIDTFDASDMTNVELYVDVDNDANYDSGTDTLVGAGTVSVPGVTGTITFTTDFAVTGEVNYLVIGDTVSIQRGASVVLDLDPADITITDATVTGSVESVTHTRGSASGGGGSSAPVGDPAPVGDGVVSGGTNDGGELIGNSPDYKLPTAESGSWTNASNAYDATDGTYASDNTGVTNEFTDYNFVVPGTNQIDGVVVLLEVSATTEAGSIGVELSWDGGTSWTTSGNTTPTLTSTDTVVEVGGGSDLWGRAWSAAEFSDTNFAIRLTGSPSSNTVQVDEIQVRVFHTATGGGGGGGGAI